MMFTKKQVQKLVKSPKKVIKNRIKKHILNQEHVQLKQVVSQMGKNHQCENVYSVVTAFYNMETYADDYFKSIVNQSVDFEKHIQIIIVDDGSTDNGVEIVKRWVNKYPNNILLIEKENGGQASARNLGLNYVLGDYVTFIDPDDFVNADYFYHVDKAIIKTRGRCAYYSCDTIFYFEADKSYKNTHPLNYRFKQGTTVVNVNDAKSIQLSSSSAFFAMQIIRDHQLEFDNSIKPNFEDGHFVNKLINLSNLNKVCFIADSKYFYRKRADQSSTLDNSWSHKGMCLNILENGLLDLLAPYNYDEAPVYLQRTILYQFTWYLKKLVNDRVVLSKLLNAEETLRFENNFLEILKYVSVEEIKKFNLAGFWHYYLIGFLNLKKIPQDFSTIVYVESMKNQKIKLRYFISDISSEEFLINSKRVLPLNLKTNKHIFSSIGFLKERIFTLELPVNSQLEIFINGTKARISFNGQHHMNLSEDLVFNSKFKTPSNKESIENRLKSKSLLHYKKTYQNCWILMDRAMAGNDNAEALYDYLDKNTDENIFFAIDFSSPDIERLKSKNYKLLDFNSSEFTCALLNAKHFMSSHLDKPIAEHLNINDYGDIIKHKFTFLQHGVGQSDLSKWFNFKPIDLIVSASEFETESYLSGEFPYKLLPSECKTLGFARYDKLVINDKGKREFINIMPTWRQYIMGGIISNNGLREKSSTFTETDLYKNWNALINSSHLKKYADRRGMKIKFIPHPNLVQYIDTFNIPEYVEVDTQSSYMDIFLSTDILVTDYSSVAFDAAFIGRKIIYFQFDINRLYDGGHISSKGYFNYKEHGFGFVGDNLNEIENYFSTDDNSDELIYSERRRNFFKYFDANNCERIYQAIKSIGTDKKPVDSYELFLNAFNEKNFSLAHYYSEHTDKLEPKMHLLMKMSNLSTLEALESFRNENELILTNIHEQLPQVFNDFLSGLQPDPAVINKLMFALYNDSPEAISEFYTDASDKFIADYPLVSSLFALQCKCNKEVELYKKLINALFVNSKEFAVQCIKAEQKKVTNYLSFQSQDDAEKEIKRFEHEKITPEPQV